LNNDNVAIIIPARYGSTRLPGKPLLEINQKPMIQWAYENAAKVKRVEKIIVATDNEKIINTVKAFGGEAILTRSDHQTGTDRIAEVAENIDASVIINLQGDEPFISPQSIEALIDTVWLKPDIVMGTLVTSIKTDEQLTNPGHVRVVLDNNRFALYFTRATIPYLHNIKRTGWLDFARDTFYDHVGLYAYRKDFLMKLVNFPQSKLEQLEQLEQLRALENGYKIKVNIVDAPGLCIDTEEDLARAREFANTLK